MRPSRQLAVIAAIAAVPVITACGTDAPTAAVGEPAILLIAGYDGTDTVDAMPAQALVVEVLDASGQPLVDAIVDLRSSAAPVFASMWMAQQEQTPIRQRVTPTTNSRGRVVVPIRFGPRAGDAHIAISVPELGISDTARYTVFPGQAAAVSLLPLESIMLSGGTVKLNGSPLDRHGNPVEAEVAFSANGDGIDVSEDGLVTGIDVGAWQVEATAGGAVASAVVLVVPDVTIAAGAENGVSLFRADGANLRTIGSGSAFTTAWSPTRDEIAFDGRNGGPVRIVDLDGAVRTLTDPTHHELYPDFSSDGESIYFSRGSWRLWRTTRLGEDEELVPMSLAESDAAPALSPDGTKLVYVRIHGASEDQLRVLNLATGNVTDLGLRGHTPRWSPQGDLVAYISYPGARLGVMSPDGSNQRLVGDTQHGYGFGIGWSPDGNWLVARNQTRNRLQLVRVEDNLVLTLPFSAGLTGPSWRP